MTNDTAVAIRKAEAADADGILLCLASAFAPFREAYTDGAFADTTLDAEALARRMKLMAVFVAEGEAGEIAGTIACSAHDGQGHLRGMAVVPEVQGTGIAERLLMAAEAELVRCGCSRVTLDSTGVLLRAMRFYERNGYERTGDVGDFFGMELHHFAKRLPAPER